jgi:tetratricopeptide (TPR) repeat protein
MMSGAGLASRAWLAIWIGDLPTADRYIHEANLAGDPRSLSLMEDPVPSIYAQVDYPLARGDYRRAEEVARNFLAQVEVLGAHLLTPKLHTARGLALVGQGRREEGQRAFEHALAIAADHGVTVGLWEIEGHLAELADADGRSDDAAHRYASAADHAEAVAIGLAPLGLDDNFRGQPVIQRILQRGRRSPPGE